MSTISLSFSLPLPLQESGRVNNLQVPPTPSNSMPLQAGVVTHCSLHWDIVWIPCCTTSKSLVPAHNSSEVEGSPQYSKRGSGWEDLVDFHQCHTLSHQKGLEEVALTSESPPTSPWDFGAYPISRRTRSSVCVCVDVCWWYQDCSHYDGFCFRQSCYILISIRLHRRSSRRIWSRWNIQSIQCWSSLLSYTYGIPLMISS